jgi:hypothetical protein
MLSAVFQMWAQDPVTIESNLSSESASEANSRIQRVSTSNIVENLTSNSVENDSAER